MNESSNDVITTKFRYFGLSIAEREVLYSLLKEISYVYEEQLDIGIIENTYMKHSITSNKELDIIYATIIDIDFSLEYNEQFFQYFTFDRWYELKNIIKEIKKRRGRKLVNILFRFSIPSLVNSTTTTNTKKIDYDKEDNNNNDNNYKSISLNFFIINNIKRNFEMAIEKIEYLVDIIPLQITKLPENIFEISYSFDDDSFKWNPYLAKGHEKNTNKLTEFHFKDGNWNISR